MKQMRRQPACRRCLVLPAGCCVQASRVARYQQACRAMRGSFVPQEELSLMKRYGRQGDEVVLSKVPYWML